ncbi:MAG: efflux RND transporter periplasmic adaptor subunit [Acidobacteria bacterium]|nr:efflux RND transporter periplasmic adaptor subunit [Acidobacteriota bacterium]
MNRTISRVAPLVLLALFSRCRSGLVTPAAPAHEAPRVVRTAPVEEAATEWTEVPGTVEAVRVAVIASRISAVIEEMKVDDGTPVRSGDLLLRLDGRDIRARVDGARARETAARAQRDRMRGLLDRDAATRAEVEAADAADAAAVAERSAAEAQLEYVDLRAPFDGVVIDRLAQAGDLARPGAPLLGVQGASGLRVQASLSAGQADRCRIGDVVEAVLEDGAAVPSRVAILGPAGEPASRRFLVKADLPAGTRARPGSFARLRLAHEAAPHVALVPSAALFERGALTGVYVVENGRAWIRWIRPGTVEGSTAVALAGVRPGEIVILDPPPLEDGTPVTPGGPAS